MSGTSKGRTQVREPRVRQSPFPSQGSIFALFSHPGNLLGFPEDGSQAGIWVCFQAPNPRSVILGHQSAGPLMGSEPCRKELDGRSSGQGPLSSPRLTREPFRLQVSSPPRVLPGYELIGELGLCSQGADQCVLWGLLGRTPVHFLFLPPFSISSPVLRSYLNSFPLSSICWMVGTGPIFPVKLPCLPFHAPSTPLLGPASSSAKK